MIMVFFLSIFLSLLALLLINGTVARVGGYVYKHGGALPAIAFYTAYIVVAVAATIVFFKG
jgi:hypothetical protein